MAGDGIEARPARGLFARAYDLALRWSRHPHASRYLFALSFAESSFFPVPPDAMLLPMALAQPGRAWRFALITTIGSVLGGVFGYLIGFFAFDLIEPWLAQSRYWEAYLTGRQWFEEWGVWAVLLAGFSPIPYKVFTLTAGVMQMAFPAFVLASLVGRGSRFFLLAALVRVGGERMDQFLRRYIDWMGWTVVALVGAWYLIDSYF